MNSEFTATWTDDYSLGLAEIDAQHKTLFELINAIWQSMLHRAELKETLHLLDELEKYTIAHFAAEETLMRLSAYPEFDKHKREHAAFVARVQQERASIAEGKASLSLSLLRFLKDWLIAHILGTDKRYGEYYRKNNQTQEKASGFRALLKRVFG